MNIGIIGGTGKEGRGLALRWALAGHEVTIGSRSAERGRSGAETLSEILSQHAGEPAEQPAPTISGGDNAWVVDQSDVVVLSVPYSAHRDTLTALKDRLAGKILVDITVPLKPPKVRQVHLPEGSAAALEAQAIVGDDVRVVATMHHISSMHLADLSHTIDSDVLVCGHKEARAQIIALIADLGLRGLDAGPLRNAVALESFTPVLLHMNRHYKGRGCGLRITGLPE